MTAAPTATPVLEHGELVLHTMGDPCTYADPPDHIDVVETHCSWVFLAGDRAYKVKKPVVLSFLDYGSLARRRALCREEVRLNRRLAPSIYRGTVALVRRDGRFTLIPDDGSVDDEALETAVEMRRFAEEDTLAARVLTQRAIDRDAGLIGATLAGFHLVAACSRDPEGALRALTAAMRATTDDLAAAGRDVIDPARVAALRRFLAAFIDGRAPDLGRRATCGLVRDGHGDLRAEHVVMTDPPQIVDCLEFDPKLRVADVAVDLSFLVMDLEDLGAPRVARLIVDGYRRAGGDPGDDCLLAGLACFRALVRAKVAAVRIGQGESGAAQAAADLARLTALAERFAWRARGPLIIACCGPAASGKSTLAGVLSRAGRLPHLSSDVLRKSLAGLSPTARAPGTAYSAGMTEATYRELAARTASAVTACGGAIVDATFHTAALRRTFLDALGDVGGPVLFVECRAPAPVLEQRVARRMRDPERVSDATAAIVRRHIAEWDEFGHAPGRSHLVVRADQPVDRMADEVLAWLDRRLEDAPAAEPRPR